MLIELYDTLSLNVPEKDGALFGMPIEGRQSLWLSVDHNAHPALFLPAREDDLRPDIILRAVDTLFSRICAIETKGGEIERGCYSLIRLKESDADIVRLFLRIIEERFCGADVPNTNAAIANNIREIASLFSRLDGGTCDLIGLWGELHVISHAQDLNSAVKCWSTRKSAKYDFVAENFVLDVKTTLSATPKHRFSLEQLRPVGSFKAYIGSLRVVEVQGGQTVGSLMDSVAKHILDAENRSDFLQQCLAKGGPNLYRNELTLQTFPSDGAIAFYRAEDIPVPQIGADAPIENVRFDVDLSSITPMDVFSSAEILEFDR